MNRLLMFLIAAILLIGPSCRGVFFNSKKTYERNLEQQPYDAVIIPGIPFRDGNWNMIMKGRVLWSVYLYKNGIARNVIYSGSSVYSPYVEAKIMAMYAEQLGVNPENIFVEPKAEHSTENVYYSYRIAKKNGFKKIALATDRFQSRTLLMFLSKVKRKTKTRIHVLPMQEDLLATMPHHDPVIDYNQAYVSDFVSIMERETFFQRVRGTLGRNIKFDETD